MISWLTLAGLISIHSIENDGPVKPTSLGFVKFFGTTGDRAPLERPILQVVDEDGSHYACTYPKGKRPRQVQDGDLVFIARLVDTPDIIVYGRAIGRKHNDRRDEASEAEKLRREWKNKWPLYIRIRQPEFIAGNLGNGVSLFSLMTELQANSFASTQENSRKGAGNIDPRHAYSQQASVRLTREGADWLNTRLEMAFATHGKLTPADLQTLDWPDSNI